jgi:hypothetical protein
MLTFNEKHPAMTVICHGGDFFAIFETSASFDDHTAHFVRADLYRFFDATSCCAARSSQEARPDFPSWASPALPLCKEKDERLHKHF